MNFKNITFLQNKIVEWSLGCGKAYPWRLAKDPYKIIITEILLQQTNAIKVHSIYNCFFSRYKTINSLNKASYEELKEHLLPFGFHYRLNKIKALSKVIVEEYKGRIPKTKNELLKLPGVGQYIASAVMCFAYGKRYPLIAADISKIYTRFFNLPVQSSKSSHTKQLKAIAQSTLPEKKWIEFNHGIIDFGAIICRRELKKCDCCFLKGKCKSYVKKYYNTKKCIDLFSGAGGLSLGVRSAGFDVAYAFESDIKAASTYEYNFPFASVMKSKLTSDNVLEICSKLHLEKGNIDLIVAGPPCQGYSMANMRTRNDKNPNNKLWRVVTEFARYLEPKTVVIENVTGIKNYKNGFIIKDVLHSFKKLKYKVKMFELNAVNFGVPQRRRRIFIVASLNSNLPEKIEGSVQDIISVGMALSDLPVVGNGNKIDELDYKSLKIKNSYQKKMRKNTKNHSVKNCLTSKNTEKIINRFQFVPEGENWQSIPKCHFDTYSNTDNCHRWLYKRLESDKPSVTISNFRKNMLIHPWEDRTLSVREAARLQGFPDEFVFMGNLRSQQQQVANAVPPQLAEAVIKALKIK
jgi:DNA (cytosine-5)-methyltransferase 1